MKKLRVVPALLLAATLGACDDPLDILPVDQIADEVAIVDAKGARATLAGAYSALQSWDMYGSYLHIFVDLPTDDLEFFGDIHIMGDMDLQNFQPDMGGIYAMWSTLYAGIDRVNRLIQKVPELDDISASDANDILGQAYGLRALHYFNLVRLWGGVPLVLAPPATPEEGAQATRASVADVYAQIESDLSQAASLLAGGGNDDHTFVNLGFIIALEAKVALYQEDWATAASKAQQLVASGDYALVTNLRDAFTAEGSPSSEDIFRVAFTTTDNCAGGYYIRYDGRFVAGATRDIYDLYEPGDQRFKLFLPPADEIELGEIEIRKYPTPNGTEDIHVIRYADVILILAEALAEQNDLSNAVGYLNQIRSRATVEEYELGTDLITQQDVLDAIYLERRLEFAWEGERWHDLVRTGRAYEVLKVSGHFEPHEVLWPIPQQEMDTSPNLVQNPGY
jgi:hypothetical protein